jgi:hypothetical protein
VWPARHYASSKYVGWGWVCVGVRGLFEWGRGGLGGCPFPKPIPQGTPEGRGRFLVHCSGQAVWSAVVVVDSQPAEPPCAWCGRVLASVE